MEIGHADDGDERHQGTHPYYSYHFFFERLFSLPILDKIKPLRPVERELPVRADERDAKRERMGYDYMI